MVKCFVSGRNRLMCGICTSLITVMFMERSVVYSVLNEGPQTPAGLKEPLILCLKFVVHTIAKLL